MVRAKSTRLPKLARLPSLPKEKLPSPARLPQEAVVPIVVYYPFRSSWEVVVYRYFIKQHPDWTPAKLLGQWGVAGSTEADEYNDTLKVAVYIDGPVHEFRYRTGRDELLRAQWKALGVRVVSWGEQDIGSDVPTLQRRIPYLYHRDVEGL